MKRRLGLWLVKLGSQMAGDLRTSTTQGTVRYLVEMPSLPAPTMKRYMVRRGIWS